MWPVDGKALSADRFSPFTPERVFTEYDGPRSFTVRVQGELFLAHWCQEDLEVARYLLAPLSEEQLREFEQGRLTCLEVLSAAPCYLVDVAHANDEALRAWEVDIRTVPLALLPAADVRLRPNVRSLPR